MVERLSPLEGGGGRGLDRGACAVARSSVRPGWRPGLGGQGLATLAYGLLVFVFALVVTRGAWAGQGNEIVVVLDNSGSMAAPYHDPTGKLLPASDPERLAALGALAVMGLSLGSTDHVTILGFGDQEDSPPKVVDPTRLPAGTRPEEAIRSLGYVNMTLFRKALEEARRILTTSTRDGKLLVFLTDGAPTDLSDPTEPPKIVGLGEAEFGTLLLGLFASPEAKTHGEAFLRPLARAPEDLVLLKGPGELVSAFTGAYARVLGSKPLTGTLDVGASKTFDVGKYVVEVLALAASSQPGAAFSATLVGPKGPAPVLSQGDNGCPFRFANAPKLCDPPRRHYQVFRQANDPNQTSRWTLTLASGPGKVDYGVILRYDIVATLAVGPTVRVGEPAALEARLLFRGNAFTDEEFFKADGFEALATLQGEKIPLHYAGQGRFVGTWTPSKAQAGDTLLARATFRNTWLERTADRTVLVEGIKELTLRVAPDPIELGAWRGGLVPTSRCTTIDLTGSTNADVVELACGAAGVPEGAQVSCTPVAGSEATLPHGKGRPLRWEVCLKASRCCGDLTSTASNPTTKILLGGKDPRYAGSAKAVPLLYRVTATGWLRCWWPVLALVAAVLFVIWVVLGLVRPHSFDAASSVRVAGSEAGLRRTSALILRELPGGVRGFYRNARVALNSAGDFVKKPRLAVLVVEAGPAGTTVFRTAAGIERKAPRTGKWEPLSAQDLGQGYAPGVVYRIGNLHVKFE